MDYSEKWGRDVDEAVRLALDDLKVSIDEVNVTVLEEPSRGFFGIGSKLALVRVEKKPKEVEIKPESVVEVPKEEPVPEIQVKEKARIKQEKAPKEKKQKKTEKHEAITKKEAEEELQVLEDHQALTFLREMIKEMGLNVDVTGKMGKEAIYLDIQGKDSGTVIGKRGQTLDAIQYLVSLVVNKDQNK